jgi:serine protease AprX
VPGTQRTYGLMSGTSMAAPIVAGTAALVREHLVRDRGHLPSAALMKAILINGTRPLTAGNAVADIAGLPNFHQGFGCLDLARSIPLNGDFVLAFVDDWADPTRAFHAVGQRQFTVVTTAVAPLRITLAYTDYWASAIQNNLELVVEPPTGPKQVGNQNLGTIGKLPDSHNNVETVRLDAAPAGKWFISVFASNVLHGGQHFALTVAGALDGGPGNAAIKEAH